MRVEYSRTADTYLRALLRSAPASAKLITAKINKLAEENVAQSKTCAVRGKKSGYMRLVAGNFRVIYQIRDDILFIADIGKRNDSAVYRKFMRTAKIK